MNRKYCLDKKEWEEAQAALLLAKQFGLIEDAGIEALEKRRAKKNKENSLYGVRFYSPAMYLQYEMCIRDRFCSACLFTQHRTKVQYLQDL